MRLLSFERSPNRNVTRAVRGLGHGLVVVHFDENVTSVWTIDAAEFYTSIKSTSEFLKVKFRFIIVNMNLKVFAQHMFLVQLHPR